ncbi:MAG: N(4)-(beta-N-acetylglucosaminyl)-L-asparaginase [Phycisphaerales bacterium]|nr:N(4)-(beta-N-acetylglucosaminyl)-L-asparaginase [Phycisphaerales bacterium]
MPKPRIVSTWTFGLPANRVGWNVLKEGGSSLDAAEAVCRSCELDLEADSVGLGGLPDSDGEVTLDGCVMLGPDQHGAVAALGHCPHAASVARLVMERSRHSLLVGRGADQFAQKHGHQKRELLTEEVHERWLEWKRTGGKAVCGTGSGHRAGQLPIDDTIGVLAIDEEGTLAGACTSSGAAYKEPGRVGDSPLIGHGLYVDPQVGAAVATGTGELVMSVCGSFLAVEELRRGESPEASIKIVLERIMQRLDVKPEHQVAMLILLPDGSWSQGAIRDGYVTAEIDHTGETLCRPSLVLLPSS